MIFVSFFTVRSITGFGAVAHLQKMETGKITPISERSHICRNKNGKIHSDLGEIAHL